MNSTFLTIAAMSNELHTNCGQPFGYIASVIYAHKKEGYNAHLGT